MKSYRFTYNNRLPENGELQVMADSQEEAFTLAYDALFCSFRDSTDISLDIGNGWKISELDAELSK